MENMAKQVGTAAPDDMPTGDELFHTEEVLVLESAADRYLRKPPGTSDQGYRED